MSALPTTLPLPALESPPPPLRRRRRLSRTGLGDRVFTTGQVAKICGVAPRTVCKWHDAGTIQGYRLPGSDDRRIPRRDLVAFLQAHGMRDALARVSMPSVLVVGGRDARDCAAGAVLPEGVELIHAADVIDVGMAVQQRLPAVVVIDAVLGRSVALAVAARLRQLGPPPPAVIALAAEDDDDASAWQRAGCAVVLRRPVVPAELAAAVTRLYLA